MTTLPQLQVLLDKTNFCSAPTPPNSAATSSESPGSKIETPVPPKPSTQMGDHRPLSLISLPDTTSPSVKPPPTPRPWLWQCHRCYAAYKVACTRRCFECGHEFCTAASVKSSSRGTCRSQFDFDGWEAWGSFRRTAAQPTATNSPANAQKKRRQNSKVDKDNFATWTPATDVDHDSSTGRALSSVKTQSDPSHLGWHAVTTEERDVVSRRKEKMYIRGEHNCWVHCDAPAECRLAVCTACVEGRARLVGSGKLMAVLLEDQKKKNKKKTKVLARSVERDVEPRESVTDGEKECAIMRTFRRKKAQILISERRPSGEITTEHVENLQEVVAAKAEREIESEDRTTSIPRLVSWPSSLDIAEASATGSDNNKSNLASPTGLLATLISGSEPETHIGRLPFEPARDEEDSELEDADDVDFAELVRISSNLSQNGGSISTGTVTRSAALVSPLALYTDINTVSIDDADGLHLSSTDTRTHLHGSSPVSEAHIGGGLQLISTASVNQPASHAEEFVDLKDLDIAALTDNLSRKGNKKRQQDDQHEKPNTRNSNILSPSPIAFKLPVYENTSLLATGTSTLARFENSASDLMDIISSSTSYSAPSLGPTTPSISLVTHNNTTRPSTSSSESPSPTIPSPPLTPDSPDNSNFPTMHNDLSMYIDDELISPVSMAARHTPLSPYLAEKTDTNTNTDKDKDSQREGVLSTLRKMQTIFMSGRSQGRLW